MPVADLADGIFALKAQSGLNSPASGAGASGIELLPSSGIGLQLATIESQMIQRSRMRKKPRHGSRSSVASYETELQTNNLSEVFQGVLGGTWVAALSRSNSEWGTVTITGTGTVATFSVGGLLADAITAGMVITFTNLSVPGNNSVHVPILSVTNTVLTFPAGYLADNSVDAAWNATVQRRLNTATPYNKRYYTTEEYLGSVIDRSKRGTDMVFNQLNFAMAPDSMVRVGFGLVGRAMSMLASGASPNFTSPVFQDAPSLTLLDGGLIINGTERLNFTGFNFGIAAPANTLPVIGSTTSPDVFLGQFAFTGQFTVAVEDATDWDLFDAETRISAFLHFAQQGGNSQDFVSVYLGDLSWAGYTTPAGGEGALIANIPIYGGEDERGAAAGFAPTTMLISTSEA